MHLIYIRKRGKRYTEFLCIFYTKFLYHEKKQVKAIKKKLIVAVKKVMTDNNAGLISKIEKDLKESIKEISRKAVEETA